ncbi:Rev1 terminal deoxycytidyl transferase [Hyphodiscus hymeniophilus]|uniref:DNA repair protein REV1 n=1 Tax=Hyphodiscus hymeniophilus TaxID=353542 RepID=A0A9P6VN38_9HELO|nr:Rev1 terminal deoxycytidyl transferase [Hyphodiscus hymeniophilus]
MGSRLEKNSESVRKRIEAHSFEDEEGDEYEGSKFGGFSDYFRRKKIKLQNLDAEVRSSSAHPQIFRGIVAHVNGYTQPSLNDLHRLIVSHGGGFMQYLDGKTTVTHIIAANLTPKKAIEFKRYRIVKPAWIVESVNAGKVLPWELYRVIDEGAGQKLLGFDDGKIVSQANTQKRGYRDQTNTSWYTSQVKNVAEDIDDDGGAQFPSSQRVTLNGTATYLDDRPRESIETPSVKSIQMPEQNLNSSFEVTSSFEAALNEVPIGNRPAKADLAEENGRVAAMALALESDAAPELKSPRVKTPPKGDDRYSPLKRPHEVENSSPSKKAKAMTAEEHNVQLLQDPRMRQSSTANPEFLKQYYSESRLHHLSTWKADLKSRFQAMAAEKSASQRTPVKRKPGSRRYIMHVDFDSFFCAVSLKSAPDYVDKPAVVAHGSGTGSEIASCNYPARTFGVKNGMWMKQALVLCPEIKVLPYDFPAYEEASKSFYEAIIDVGGIVQSVSIDEALIDITSLCLPAGGSDGVGVKEGSIWREQEKANQIAEALRRVVKETTQCAVSVGIGGNILLAKVALRKAKPAGQHQIKPEEALDFVAELKVTDLPGVAYSIGGKLEEIGVIFVKDVRELSKERLMTVLGPKTGEKIWDYSRGIDRTEVGEQVVRKSVSAEVNWGIRFISQPEAEEFVRNLCGELQRRLVEQKVKGRQFTMKIMKKAADAPLDPPKHLGHGKCDTYNKSIVLGVATNSAEVTGREAVSILRSYGFSAGELRGLGVQMTKLEPLKPSDALPDGSQKRINFGKSITPKLSRQITEDPIDDPQTPRRDRKPPNFGSNKVTEDPIDETTPQKPRPFSARLIDSDPIDDINSPKKTKSTPIHPATAIARANAADSSATKLLNLTGTQFILPTQIDQSVLAELPQHIQSRLMAQSRSASTSRDQSPALKSRSNSPTRQHPIPSQIDPEVFAALPEDMKAEVLASYKSNGPNARGQSLLPQSPRKSKPLPPKKWTPTKKRGRPPGSKNRLTDPSQSNFIRDPFKSAPKPITVEAEDDSDDGLDPDFLSALPEDMRAELVAEHMRKQKAKGVVAELSLAAPKKRKPIPLEPMGQRRLKLPPREPRPTFTTQGLSTLPQLRETLSAWFEEFSKEGPHPDDVGAMERYLKRVVLDERDLGKVQAIVRWLAWLVDCGDDSHGTRSWGRALEGMKDKIQDAVKERGLGRLEL